MAECAGSRPALWVGVQCDRKVSAANEVARGDRIIAMAASEAYLVREGVVYGLCR